MAAPPPGAAFRGGQGEPGGGGGLGLRAVRDCPRPAATSWEGGILQLRPSSWEAHGEAGVPGPKRPVHPSNQGSDFSRQRPFLSLLDLRDLGEE